MSAHSSSSRQVTGRLWDSMSHTSLKKTVDEFMPYLVLEVLSWLFNRIFFNLSNEFLISQ